MGGKRDEPRPKVEAEGAEAEAGGVWRAPFVYGCFEVEATGEAEVDAVVPFGRVDALAVGYGKTRQVKRRETSARVATTVDE